MSPRSQSPLSFEYVLLGLLHQKSMHGYDLNKEVAKLEGVGLVWRIKQSKLYALLEKMQLEGWLDSMLVMGESRPARKEYSLTGRGLQVYLNWVQSPVQHGRDMRQDFLARLHFALELEKNEMDYAHHLLDSQCEMCHRWLENLQEQLGTIDQSKKYERIVYRFRLIEVKAMIEWIEEARTSLDT